MNQTLKSLALLFTTVLMFSSCKEETQQCEANNTGSVVFINNTSTEYAYVFLGDEEFGFSVETEYFRQLTPDEYVYNYRNAEIISFTNGSFTIAQCDRIEVRLN
ncbi:hypothetical protein SAMN05421640_3210 [Ekhidna lutea]|uniref:Uncharacterized protein n=1 Tax=Ekhidna lutea TaxID=447679 RepID=A0A239LE45_EKHLU|nr:hypothetical protein [Ekhidna lutea]SNT28907.1 hypothetical protein SAMN05421640_3210 [Ekhidna lutea]